MWALHLGEQGLWPTPPITAVWALHLGEQGLWHTQPITAVWTLHLGEQGLWHTPPITAVWLWVLHLGEQGLQHTTHHCRVNIALRGARIMTHTALHCCVSTALRGARIMSHRPSLLCEQGLQHTPPIAARRSPVQTHTQYCQFRWDSVTLVDSTKWTVLHRYLLCYLHTTCLSAAWTGVSLPFVSSLFHWSPFSIMHFRASGLPARHQHHTHSRGQHQWLTVPASHQHHTVGGSTRGWHQFLQVISITQ